MTDDIQQRYAEFVGHFAAEAEIFSNGPLNGRSSEDALAGLAPEPSWVLAATNQDLQPHPFHLAELWQRLGAGTWQFQDIFSSAQRHFALVARVEGAKRSSVHSRNWEMLTRVLRGQLPKAVAQDMRVAISTVATGMRECLRGMGLPHRASSPPVLLMMAARAAESPALAPTLGRLTRINAQDEKQWLLSVPRPDLEFPVPLSEAEASVIRQLVSGRTHTEISSHRATSPRTVANQLASVFKKFGVSGRSAILQRLITHCFERSMENVPRSLALSNEMQH